MKSPVCMLALLSTLFGAGCAQFSFLAPEDAVDFALEARIAVRFRDEASSGGVSWRHRADADEVLLTSPLGQGVARIVRAGSIITLTTADAKEHSAEDAESLTESVLGFRLPLAGLADWVRGRAAPGPSRSHRDASGRLERLEQAGWLIEYSGYSGELPSRMKLSYPGLEIRLAIGEWSQPDRNRAP